MAHIFTKEENEAWHKTLPTKHVAVKTIINNKNGDILLVKPNYRAHWHIPGGGVDAGESPWDAAVRELSEETGIVVNGDNLRIVDILHRSETDDMNIVFATDITAEAEKITIQPEELEAFAFVSPNDMRKYLSAGMGQWWAERGGVRYVDSTR